MSLVIHAKRECRLANESVAVTKVVMELIRIFSKQGHSESSALYTASKACEFFNLRSLEFCNKRSFIDPKSIFGVNDFVYSSALKLAERFFSLASEYKLNFKNYHRVIEVFNVVSRFGILTPLTGKYREWQKCGYTCTDDVKYQNKRLFTVFKRVDGTAFNLEAKVFVDRNGMATFKYTDTLNSSEDITFPYSQRKLIVHI
jgi:hypothetical protein